jgi:hypothetical protein
MGWKSNGQRGDHVVIIAIVRRVNWVQLYCPGSGLCEGLLYLY